MAAADNRPEDMDASLTYAAELAQRTGEGNAYGLGFGPVSVGLFRIQGLVEARDYEGAVSIAEGLNPDAHATDRSSRAYYWTNYGRALARVRVRVRGRRGMRWWRCAVLS